MPEEAPVTFAKFLRTPFLLNNPGWLLLKCEHCNNEARDRLYRAPYVDISGIIVKRISLSVIQALGVYGSIGAKYIKFQLELHFFIHSSMFI